MAETFTAVRTVAASASAISKAFDTYDASTPGGAGFVWNATRTQARESAPDGSSCEVSIRALTGGRCEVRLALTPAENDAATHRVLRLMGDAMLGDIIRRVEVIAQANVDRDGLYL